MNRRSRGLPLWVLLAVAGCGGGVGGIRQPGDDGAPGDRIVGDDAGILFNDGSVDDGGVDLRCASGSPVGTGQACGAAGLMCPLGTLTDCNGNVRTLECLCNGNVWTCDPVTTGACEPPPPPPACPDPSTLVPGSSCAPDNQQCVSTDIFASACGIETKAICQCVTGAWSCPFPPLPVCPPPPPPPSGSCPDPYSLYSGQSCTTQGICSGNPTDCSGQVYYDALECESGTWVTIAATACDIGEAIDAGSFDGEALDVGVASGD
jgi:hypothetical protein